MWEFFKKFTVLALVFAGAASEGMTEKLGQLELTDVLLRPYFLLKEPQEGEFQLGETSVQFTWHIDRHFRSIVRVGPKAMWNPMARFNTGPSSDIGLVEAYGLYTSLYGEVKAGMIPINYAAEGSLGDGNLYFPRSNLFENRVIPLRDMGIEYAVQHNGYYSDLKVHNGEGPDNPDGRMWVSGNWGWKDRNKFQVGLAGMTGTTKPISTSTSGDTLANVDETQEARWRMGTFFLRWFPGEWKTLLEVSMGEVEQGADDKVVGRFKGGHFDLVYEKSRWAVMSRWQYFEPSSQAKNDLQRETSLGLIFKNQNQTSKVFIIGTKIVEDGAKVANDELRLIWQLTPLVTEY